MGGTGQIGPRGQICFATIVGHQTRVTISDSQCQYDTQMQQKNMYWTKFLNRPSKLFELLNSLHGELGQGRGLCQMQQAMFVPKAKMLGGGVLAHKSLNAVPRHL